MSEDEPMTTYEAIGLARMWRERKIVCDDAHEACVLLLGEIERIEGGPRPFVRDKPKGVPGVWRRCCYWTFQGSDYIWTVNIPGDASGCEFTPCHSLVWSGDPWFTPNE